VHPVWRDRVGAPLRHHDPGAWRLRVRPHTDAAETEGSDSSSGGEAVADGGWTTVGAGGAVPADLMPKPKPRAPAAASASSDDDDSEIDSDAASGASDDAQPVGAKRKASEAPAGSRGGKRGAVRGRGRGMHRGGRGGRGASRH
jgi:hypothetical protein